MVKENNLISDLFSSLLLISLCMVIISPFIALSFISVKFLAGLLFKNILATNFISLLVTLIIFTYLPDNILDILSPIIERYVETNSCYYPPDYREGSVTIFLMVLFKAVRLRSRLKISIYAISLILILITNLQDCGVYLIRNQYLKDIRVVINGAILTFIVFDRMVNEYHKLREKEKAEVQSKP
jgi:hypothetical protein